MEAKLNYILGAEVFDQLFLGFECGSVVKETAHIFVESEEKAAIVESEYSWHVAIIVESIMKKRIKYVTVGSKSHSERQAR